MTFEIVSVPSPVSCSETVEEYGCRLEALGLDEMRIRKEILRHFWPVDFRKIRIFNHLSDARIRYITWIHELNPSKTHKGLVKKIAASMGISEDEAEKSVSRFEEIGGMPRVKRTSSKVE